MPDNAELRQNLSKARKKEMYFAYVSGGERNKMVMDKKPIKPSQSKELKEQAGGGKLVVGTCQFQDGELHLTIEKGRPSPQIPKTMRNVIKDETGFSWKIAIDEGGGGTEEEEAEEA